MLRSMLFLLSLTIPVTIFAAEAPHPLAPAAAGVGRRVPELDAKTIDGKEFKLSAYAKDRKAVVVAMTSTSCPICKKYLPTLAQLQKDFASKGVEFVLINPVATDKDEDMTKALKDAGMTVPYIHDRDGTLAKAVGATTTTDVFVIDAKRTVIYRGAVDDQYGIGYSKESPKLQYLRNALLDILDGKEPRVQATTAPGCELDLSKAKASDVAKVTYHNRVSRIVQLHCQECHRKGGLGPFPMETMEDVISHKGTIKRVVDTGIMPPWFAKEDKDKPSHFKNNRAMPEADKKDLLDWLANGNPEGDIADAPLPRNLPKEWMIGKPDVVYQIPKAVDIKATGTMPYHNVTIDTNLTEDKWVVAGEVQPSAREVVHHVLVFVLPPPLKIGDYTIRTGGGEAQGYFAAYVPGMSWQVFPEGFGRKVPKGSRLRFQIHYTPTGTATKDQTRIGFRFADKVPENEVKVLSLANPKFEIPPGEADYKNSAQFRTPVEATILAMSPHAHLRGKASQYELIYPDGTKKILLDVPHYDFNWQLQYRLAEPLTIPRGTVIKYTGWFDNSTGNPANPDPKAKVKWGQQTSDEMLLGYMEYYLPTKGK